MSSKSVKYKKQKLTSEAMAEILRSSDEEDLVEFINSSFPQNGPCVANNNKRRSRTANKHNNDEPMQEIDLDGASSSSQRTTYDLSSNGESIIVGDKPKMSRFCITFGLFLSFLALGISIAILGPSLLDLKDQVHSSFQGMSTVFTARSVGYLIGSVVAGWLLDRWNGYFVMTASCLMASISLVITPFTRSFVVLMFTIVCQGLALGSLDTGGNVLLLNIHGSNSDAQMQGLHAMFGLGAFVSPLMVGPFLTTTSSPTHAITNSTNMTNITSLTPTTNLSSNHSTTSPTIIDHSSLTWPYIMSVLFFIVPIIIFTTAGLRDSGRSQQQSKPWENVQGNDQRAYRGFTLVLLFVFLMLYVGLEVGIGGLIFSFSFKHGILKSKSMAAYLTSTFWGSFCAGRFLAIPLAVYVRAYRILVCDLLGCVIGACMLVFLSSSHQAWLWVGTSLLGLSMSAVFPSTMSWAETFMHISGKTASILVVGASCGEMTIPLIIGTLMERKGADVFLDSILIIICLAIFIFILATILARRQQREQINGFGIHYHKSSSDQPSNHSLFSKGDEIVQLLEDSSEIFSVEN